jgi:hypothetical protein
MLEWMITAMVLQTVRPVGSTEHHSIRGEELALCVEKELLSE